METKLLLLLFAFLLISNRVAAVAYTWQGGTSSWTTASNWTPAGIPGPGDNVTISALTPNEPSINANTTISGLTMNNNHTLVLNGFNLAVTSVANVNLANVSLGLFAMGGGSVDITAPDFNFSGCIFDATLNVTKTGIGTSTSSACVYNGITNFFNGTAATIRLGAAATPDAFNNDVTFNNSGTGWVYPAYQAAGNNFARNIYVNCTNGGGIVFGMSGGTSTLAAGFTLSEGGTGFTRGTLDIRNFTQLGNTPQFIDLSWPGVLSASMLVLTVGPNVTFNGSTTLIASNLLLNTVTFNGALTSLSKVVNGGSLNTCVGGNTFNSNTTFITNGTGTSEWRFAGTAADTYNGDVAFIRSTSGGIISPAYTGINRFYGNISFSSGYVIGPGAPVTFGAGGGTARFDGGNAQAINKTTAIMAAPVFYRVDVNKTANDLTLNTPVTIQQSILFSNGLVNSTATNLATLQPGATTNIGGAASYNNGPINCMVAAAGASSVIFPVGKAGAWRPAALSTTHLDASSVTYTGELIASSAAALLYSLPSTISNISTVRYWQINRQAVANFTSATVTLYYDTDDGVTNYTNLTVAKTIGVATAWNDIGGTATANGTGNITSGTFTSFSKFVLANSNLGSNPLPIELLSFAATADNNSVDLNWTTATEINNDFFTVERSNGLSAFETIGTVRGAGNSSQVLHYALSDFSPFEGENYYRLKQTDFDGLFTYTAPVHVVFTKRPDEDFQLYPNPGEGPVFASFGEGLENSTALLTVSDMMGKTISRTSVCCDETRKISFNEDHLLAPGIYNVTLDTETGHHNQRLVIIKPGL